MKHSRWNDNIKQIVDTVLEKSGLLTATRLDSNYMVQVYDSALNKLGRKGKRFEYGDFEAYILEKRGEEIIPEYDTTPRNHTAVTHIHIPGREEGFHHHPITQKYVVSKLHHPQRHDIRSRREEH